MKQSSLISLLVILIPCTLVADWEKIDDFEYDNPADMWNTWFLSGQAADLCIADVLVDPADSENQALHFDNNAYNTNLWILQALVPKVPIVIPDGSEATFYFRWFWTGVNHASSPMFTTGPDSWLEPGTEENPTDRPLDFTVLQWDQKVNIHSNVRDYDTRTANLDVYDNDKYRLALLPSGTEFFEMPLGTWVEYWIHIVNAPGATGGDEYSVYVRETGEEQKRLLIEIEGGLQFNTMLFRGQYAGDITQFRYVSYTGPFTNRFLGDMVLIDDIYMDYSGLNTDTPDGVRLPTGSVEFWRGLPVARSGEQAWVESPLYGWMEVTLDPFLWSGSLGTWMYTPEYKGTGGWIYTYPSSDTIPDPGTGEVWNNLPVSKSGDQNWVESPLFGWILVNDDPYIWAGFTSSWLYLPEYNSTGCWSFYLPSGG